MSSSIGIASVLTDDLLFLIGPAEDRDRSSHQIPFIECFI